MAGDKEKHENFKRLATGRTNRVLKGMSLLENLTASRYAYMQEDLDKITDLLQKGLDALKLKFRPQNLTLEF